MFKTFFFFTCKSMKIEMRNARMSDNLNILFYACVFMCMREFLCA